MLRSIGGHGLPQELAFTFRTRAGTEPYELFRDRSVAGPASRGIEVSHAPDLDHVPLGLFAAMPIEVRVHFDQALHPAASNVPVGIDIDPRTRDASHRGRIHLEYTDITNGAGQTTWIPAAVEFERNAYDGATVVLRPLGVLPNHATVRVIVEPELMDIAGQWNVGAPGFDRVFGTFRTADAWGQQWTGIVERFDALSRLDRDAAFPEPMAEVGPGQIASSFAFDGEDTTFDYAPTAVETVLNTNEATLAPVSGASRTVTGGVFRVRDLTIAAGTTVLGQGSNPMVFVCTGKVTIAGTLSVRGGNGDRGPGFGSTSPNGPGGGVGCCGGGNGGQGSPGLGLRDLRGGAGRGPGQAPAGGGNGGYLACLTGCYTGSGYNGSGGGSGGGGGSMATQGDPSYRGITPALIQPNIAPTANTTFQQVRGYGGSGCSGGAGTRTAFLIGGEPGPRTFADTRTDNDFWGSAYDARRQLRITGELTVPVGGGGGGGGGDTSPAFDCSLTGGNPNLDHKGGGGGAGGGVIVIKALDEIWIPSTGRIVADGGHGGGGAQVGSCGEAGGGGGGAGGMVVLMSAKAIRIEAHGTPSQNRYVYGAGTNGPFQGNEYSFAISADGGICTTGGFGSINLSAKYPAAGNSPVTGTTYDQDPLGGFGGMGVVQLMTPAGNNSDGTNTVLDDNIHFYLPGQLAASSLASPIVGAGKRQLLAWRGFPDGTGASFDDFGQVVDLGKDEGDIRPAPILLPAPFGPRSRARSHWIDTGRSDRRALAAPDAFARGVVVGNGVIAGPRFEFMVPDPATGFAAWTPTSPSTLRLAAPVVVPSTPLASVDAQATFHGAPAYRLHLATAALPVVDRYRNYEVELQDPGETVLARYRILAHDERELLVEPGAELLPTNASMLRIVARFFDITTNGIEGLLPRPSSGAGGLVPQANVRVGFAFHTDPSNANPLAGRYPPTSEQHFVQDLADPQLLLWLAANQPRFVQWDITFDVAFDGGTGAPRLTISPPRLALQSLRLPFRF